MTTWQVILVTVVALLVVVPLLALFALRELRIYRATMLPRAPRPTIQEQPWPASRRQARELSFDSREARERLGRLGQ